MTVRDLVGRTRYVAFRVEGGPVGRTQLAAALPPAAKLTRFDGTYGLARCLHRDLDELRRVLNLPHRVGGRDVRLVSLASAGTLRAAARALPPDAEAARSGSRPAASKPRSRKID